MLGDAIEWNGNAYSASLSYTLPETWNAENLRVVVLVNRPETSDGPAAQVLNAEQFALSTLLADIADATAGSPAAQRTFFDLSGRALAAPAPGFCIERIATPQGIRSVKRVK